MIRFTHLLILAACLLVTGCLYEQTNVPPVDGGTEAQTSTSTKEQKDFYRAFAGFVRKGAWTTTDELVKAFHDARVDENVPADPKLMSTTFPEFEKNQDIDSTLQESIAQRLEKLAK